MKTIEYFYSAHSAYAYIGSKLLMETARDKGARIDHRPMDLRAVVAATGPGPHNSRTPERRLYFSGREIERWAEYRGVGILPWPAFHDHEIASSNGMLIAGLLQGTNIDALAHRFLEAHWRDDADLADKDTLAALARDVGLDPAPLLGAIGSPEVTAVYEANTKEAIERSVFGSPTYFVDGDMFYGQDHLELVARALEHPFKGTWPRG
ncbi:MAG: 2-hydroxychromene-2-carboxylate isomerase [Rhodospirillales bacterium]|nr:2-hydroxychromene-2-carboxylate isomerase [Rhodospirillales bacterium]